MSMMKTLAKVAIGVAVAKGVSGMMKKSAAAPSAGQTATRGQTAARGQVGSGGLFGGMYSPGAQQQTQQPAQPQGGGLEDMLGSILGGARLRANRAV